LTALFCTLILSNGDCKGLVLSSIAVVAQFIVYSAFLPRTSESLRLIPYIGSFDETLGPLSWRTLVILSITTCIHTSAFGFSGVHVLSTLSLGAGKALSWYFIAQTVREYLSRRFVILNVT
jgi:hypothetical protein